MSVTADQIAALAKLGITGEKLAAVVEIFERDASRHASRDGASRVTLSVTPGALRAKRYRDNKRLKTQQKSHVSGVALATADSVTQERDASRDGVTNAPLTILSSSEPLNGNQEVSEEDRKVVVEGRKRGVRLRDDWEPSADDLKFAAARGLRLIDVEIEATKFRNYWTNRADKLACKLRWDRAWQNWILNVKPPVPNGRNNVIAAADNLVETMRQWERKDGPDLLENVRGGTRAPDVRMLPAK